MGGPRKATRRISGRIDDGYLELSIAGVGDRRWKLPAESDRAAIGVVAREAKAWAMAVAEATKGQTNYIQKVLSEGGYHEGTPRRLG